MRVHTTSFSISTHGGSEVIDITGDVEAIIEKSGMHNGLVTVFVSGSTASMTTTEFEPGLRKDIPETLERLIPKERRYYHDETWHDGNGYSHLRAALMGPSLSIPLADGGMTLGTWQQIVLVDHDNRPRTRKVVVQVLGE